MSDFRVKVEAEFTVPKRKNVDSTKNTVIKMIKGSGFKEKDFIISIDKTELIENLPEVQQKEPKKKEKIKNKEKKVIKRTRRKNS